MTVDRKHCEGCPLESTGDPMGIVGDPAAPYMVVTDTPTSFAARRGALMNPKSSAVFSDAMREEGFTRQHFFFVPQIRCPHDPSQFPTKERRAIQQHCREHFLDDINDYRPEVVIPLGSEAARQVMGRAVQITKVRGTATYSEELSAHVYPILNPGQVVAYPQHKPLFAADVASFARMVDSGFDRELAASKILGDYEIVTDLQFLIDQNPDVVFFDMESTGLKWFEKGTFNVRNYDPEIHKGQRPNASVLTMQFCIEPGKAYMVVWDHPEAPASARTKQKLRQQIRTLLCKKGRKVVGQNVKIDQVFTRAHVGVNFKIGGDTLMLATLLDENALTKNQDVLVKQYVPEMAGYADEFNATTDKSRMWEVPLSKMLGYGCGDVDSGYRLFEALWEKVKQDKKLVAHYRRVSLPGLNTFAAMEMRGLPVDEHALNEFEALMSRLVEQQKAELLDQVPKSIKRAHIDKGLSFSRPDFVRDILFKHRDGFRLKPMVYTKTTAKLPAALREPSISSKDHLPYFFEECPFTMLLAQHVKDSRLLSTNIQGFKEKYIIDGLVRPTYSLTTARTGRTSSEDPNGQNFPKRGPNATAYRRSYVAPPGYVVLEADLSQAELRISADMANDKTMLSVYNSGGDIHSTTAAATLNVSLKVFKEWAHDKRLLMEVANSIPGSGDFLRKMNPGKRREATVKDYYKAKRQEAKAINFGFIYGMGWRKFIGYAKTQYGVEFNDEEAQGIRTAFFAKYAHLPSWHDRMRAFAQDKKFVRSYSGRIRHLPMIDSDEDGIRSEAGRQAINSPVQEFASSLGVMAMGRLHEEIDPQYLAPIAFVHDAIYCFVPEEYAVWGAQTLKWFMQSNPIEEWFGIKLKCPIVADVSIGRNLGDTYEMEGITVDEEYDYTALWDEEAKKGIKLCEQRTPPGNGDRTTPAYDLVD